MLKHLRNSYPLLCLVCILQTSVGICVAEETLGADELNTNNAVQPVKLVKPIKKDDDSIWLEGIHNTVAGTVFHSARWFDNFFTDDDSELQDPKTNLRIRLAWIPKEGDSRTIEQKYRLRLQLPNLKNKVDLVFSDDEILDENDAKLEEITNDGNNETNSFTAAIRLVHSKTLGSLLDSRLGVSGGDIFYRSRYKKRYRWSEKHSIKFEPSIYYYLNDGFRSKTFLEYNCNLSLTEQLRISSSFNTSENYQGIRWGQGIHKLTQLSQSSASSYGIQINGTHNGELGSMVDVYTTSYKYRFNAVREWLFFEVEPFYEWREDNDYRATLGIALRIEGHFIRD